MRKPVWSMKPKSPIAQPCTARSCVLGYYPTVRVAKTRRTATLERCSLCVDDLEGVGGFLELERLVRDDVSAEVVQTELATFVASLGLRAVRTDETYDSLVRAAQASSA